MEKFMQERSQKKQRPKRTRRPLYHASKISEARLKKVLWHFAKDDTVAEAARQTGLSQNAVSTIFVKLRRFFTEVGMFTDVYEGGDPADGIPGGEPDEAIHLEFELIEFHFARVKAKRGLGLGPAEIDQFNESHWRFHYVMLMGDRGSDAVHHMMHWHLLEMVRRCGPVGRPPVNRREGLRLGLAQMDERIRWAAANSLRFRDEAAREQLHAILRC